MSSGACFSLDLGDRPQLIAYLLRAYSPETIQVVLSHLPKGGLFVDVGAHVGLISLAVGVLRPDVTVYAFEPSPGNAAAWRVNRDLNPGTKAELLEAGLSDKIGTGHLDIAGNTASGMLTDGRGIPVPILTLDSFCGDASIDRIDVLKVDVEGHEPAVLRGASRLLGQGAIGTIIAEVTDALLRKHGTDRQGLLEQLEAYGYASEGLPEAGLRRYLPLRFQLESVDRVFTRRTSDEPRGITHRPAER